MATWREEHHRQQRAAVPGRPARCGSGLGEVGAALPPEHLPWAANAWPQQSKAPGAGQAYSAAPQQQQLLDTAARAPARPGRALGAARSFRQPFPPCSGSRAPTPPVLLPASSQGRATAVASAKLRFPQAALASGSAPPRPCRILRSPCRPAAICDRRRRNLPKTRAGNGRTCVRF